MWLGLLTCFSGVLIVDTLFCAFVPTAMRGVRSLLWGFCLLCTPLVGCRWLADGGIWDGETLMG